MSPMNLFCSLTEVLVTQQYKLEKEFKTVTGNKEVIGSKAAAVPIVRPDHCMHKSNSADHTPSRMLQ